MYTPKVAKRTSLHINESTEGISIERSIEQMLEQNEPIGADVSVIYTERKDGVPPAYDIRTDRFDVGIEAADHIQKTHAAKRENRHSPKEQETSPKPSEGESKA